MKQNNTPVTDRSDTKENAAKNKKAETSWGSMTVGAIITNILLFMFHDYIKGIPFIPIMEVVAFFGMFFCFSKLVGKATRKDLQERMEDKNKRDGGYSYLGM